jgi:2-iminoacetate synthase ThiH
MKKSMHIVGGHHRTGNSGASKKWSHDPPALAALCGKAFTASEIDYFWRRWKIRRNAAPPAGLGYDAGRGAEVFSERVWKLLPRKAGPDRYGNPSHRAPLGNPYQRDLYSHIETDEERVQHLVRLREVQDGDRIFTFIPLAYRISSHRLQRTAGFRHRLKVIATSRLMPTTSTTWSLLDRPGVECAETWRLTSVRRILTYPGRKDRPCSARRKSRRVTRRRSYI